MKWLLHAVLVAIGTAVCILVSRPRRTRSRSSRRSRVIGDMVTNVAGDLVDLVTIVGPDSDCEEYEPTAADVPKMANARILFMNGLMTTSSPGCPT